MNELFLYYLWDHQLIQPNPLTTDGEKLRVIRAGTRNLDSGPDFFNSLIMIGETKWAGNIEIHVNSSDWYLHGHEKDSAYENIILHVVFRYDATITRPNGEVIPTLELDGHFDKSIFTRYQSFLSSDRWIPCETQITSVNQLDLLAWLDALMGERLEEKATGIELELDASGQDFHEIFYRKLCRGFGFRINSEAFESLAVSLPFNLLSRHMQDRFQIEALLFGQAGMLNRTFKDRYPQKLKTEYQHLKTKYDLKPLNIRNWKFLRMRPKNFPTLRLSQLAHLLEKSPGLLHGVFTAENLANVITYFQVSASDYWTSHYIFDRPSKPAKKKLGRSSVDILLINTVIPFLFVYGKRSNKAVLSKKAATWMEQIGPERNKITEQFMKLGVEAVHASQTQALIHLKTRYCDERGCLSCAIGRKLLQHAEGDDAL